jgi:xylulokinase
VRVAAGTAMLQSAASLVGLDDDGPGYSALADEAMSRPATVDGLVVAARPGVPPRATVSGLEPETPRANLARAALEGVACELLDARDALVTAGVSLDDDVPMVVAGSSALHEGVAQVLADTAGAPVELREVTEDPAASGAAIQAAAVLLGRAPDEIALEWSTAPGVVIEPVSDDSDRAASVRARNRALRRALRDLARS